MTLVLATQFSFLVHSGFWLDVCLSAAIYGIFALGMQLNIGTTGVANFGQAGFMAVGSYAAVIVALRAGVGFWPAVVVGIAAAIVSGVLVGVLLLRLRSDYFAIGTLAFAESARLIADSWNSVTGGSLGLLGYTGAWSRLSAWIERELSHLGIGPNFLLPLLVLSAALFLVSVAVVWGLTRTPWGRVLKAIRADEDAARALGKRTTLYKVQSLSIAAALAAVAGILLAVDVSVLTPETFDPSVTIYGLMIVMVGGVGSYSGVVFGSLLLFVILDGTRYIELPLSDSRVASLRFMIVGALLILAIALRPQGVLGRREELTFE